MMSSNRRVVWLKRASALAFVVVALALAGFALASAAPLNEPTITTLTSSANPSSFGAPVTFTADVWARTGIPTGVVTFTIGSATSVTATLTGGQAFYTTASLPVGEHQVAAEYAGDVEFDPSVSNSLTQTIRPPRLYLPGILRHWPPVPYAPVLSAIEKMGDQTFRVNWSQAELATVYSLQEDTSRAFLTPQTVYFGPALSWDSGVKATGNYCYRVRGENAEGVGAWSSPQCIELACRPVFADDFSNTGSGWPSWDTDISTAGYEGGEYRILVKKTNYVSVARSGHIVSDFDVFVDTRAAGHTDGATGIVFGYSSANGFYIFEVAYGQYAVSLLDRSSGWKEIIPPTTNGAIYAGNATNRLEVRRKGTRIGFYANRQLLAEVDQSDPRFMMGEVGLASDAMADWFDGRFDNFALYDGSCQPAGQLAAAKGSVWGLDGLIWPASPVQVEMPGRGWR